MISVFLSYSARDREIATRLASDLKRRGVRVWFDQDQVLVGDSIIERVRDGISGADYLLVLLSGHSSESSWVTKEIEAAFRLHGHDANRLIIPVRLDDAPLPGSLAEIRYLDLRENYEQALSNLLDRFARDQESVPGLNKVIDPEGLAKAIAVGTKARRGPEFYLTAILGALTIIVTLITAWPSFQTAFGRVSKVYYDVESQAITLPAAADKATVLRILDENGVAPAGLRIRVINKGQAKADEVRIGATVAGQVIRVETNPSPDAKSVWVDLNVEPVPSGGSQGRVTLKNLVPEKLVTIDVGYKPQAGSNECDVVADGMLAARVEDTSAVPGWTVYRAFETPLLILAAGIALSFLVGILTAASRNPRLSETLVAIVDAVFPTIGKMVRLLTK